MADGVTLHDLIEAIANAVIGAQDKVERHQISNIRRFFDGNNRPIGVEVLLPKMGGRDGEEMALRVPLIALVGATRLSIKDVEITMDVEIGELTALPTGDVEPAPAASDAAATSGWDRPDARKAVVLDLQAPRSQDRSATAKVFMRVQSHEPPEGVARLMVELNKRIGVPIGGGNDGQDQGGNT